MLTPEIQDRWIELLAHIYMAIKWSKINTRHNAWDIWNHRVRAASTRGTVGAFSSRLANHFGLQSLPEAAVELIGELEPHAADLLDWTYREHIPVSMRGVSRAKAWKQAKYGHRDELAKRMAELEEILEDTTHGEAHSGPDRGPVANPTRRRREDRIDPGPSLFDTLGQ